jgi:RIO-like serine/threonine protein kinase|tara:strand:- start:63 stop:674 length:612 start_codon:yes stop_codon:yes gene_type:complete
MPYIKYNRTRIEVDQYDDFLIQKTIMNPGQTKSGKIGTGRAKIRTVHNYKTHYRKHWNYVDPQWFHPHIDIVNRFRPGYIISSRLTKKAMWIDYKVIPGIRADHTDFIRDDQFTSRIHNFVISNIQETYPYVHGDWTMHNMIIDGTDIELIDWDSCQIHTHQDIIKLFNLAMTKNFGSNYLKNFSKRDHPLIPILQSLSETHR